MKNKLQILGDYVGHLVTGVFMFAALLLFGGALSTLARWAATVIGDSHFSLLMIGLEKVILVSDIIFVAWWAIYSTYKAIKELTQ